MSFGHISGRHFNPAVTLSVTLAVTTETGYATILGGATWPIGWLSGHWHHGLIVETILTFILCQTVLMCAVDTNTNVIAGLCIGFAIALDFLGGGNTSGASMNPARSFGPCVVATLFEAHHEDIWGYHFIYWVGPFLGAALASLVYKVIYAADDYRLLP
ncbi:unnamed protein product [Bursaphelenchus okinawaensis]|uniref:Aquaporin n=1 Tax=Bursaphelenchus okinawaensis TaxID=465554 RepID=A0A811LEE3_9BILA|nr:unnamed protein product [Bursaphelenchus okinawaensis]CAG9122306.1 unnamed protein product [Bursaphelenchus okinawaensis]